MKRGFRNGQPLKTIYNLSITNYDELSSFFLNRDHPNRMVNASPQRQGSPNLGVIRFMITQIG